MNHPSSLDLEAFAVGEPLPSSFTGHVEACAECAALVGRLQALVATGPSPAEAEDAVSRAVARAMTEPSSLPANDVTPLRQVSGLEQRKEKRLWVLATSVITPLAAAAAILLLARSGPLSTATPTPSTTVSRILMAPFPGAPGVEREREREREREPETQFKGGPQVAVIRERGGQQARFSGAVRVRPGDRIRVEVALDREQAILGAVLGDDGTYLELMPESLRGPGTHFSEKSAKFDDAPTHGTILIGTRDAVARARATHLLDGVTSVRIEWESP